jgi:hypothetical protein
MRSEQDPPIGGGGESSDKNFVIDLKIPAL